MFNPEYAQVGDILFYEANNLLGYVIGFFSDIFHPFDKKVSHVSKISQIDADGTIHIIESHIRSSDDEGVIHNGVVEKTLNPKWYNIIIHKRLNGGLERNEKVKLIKYDRDNLIGKQYDEWSFPSKFFRSIFIAKETPLLNDQNKFDCAECVAVSYKKGIGIDLAPNINMHTVNPQQLCMSERLTTVRYY